MRRCILELHATPFKAEALEEIFRPYAARALTFGATSYSFARSDDDPLHFIFTSDWPDPDDFDRYWYGGDMREAREKATGMFQVPLVPHWAELIAAS